MTLQIHSLPNQSHLIRLIVKAGSKIISIKTKAGWHCVGFRQYICPILRSDRPDSKMEGSLACQKDVAIDLQLYSRMLTNTEFRSLAIIGNRLVKIRRQFTDRHAFVRVTIRNAA